MDIFLLYLWTRLDVIEGASFFASIVIAIGLLYSVINFLVNNDMIDYGEKYKQAAAAFKSLTIRLTKYLLIPLACLVLIPSQKDATIIAGGWAVKQIATSDKAQQISTKTFDLINGKLDEELSKLKKDSK